MNQQLFKPKLVFLVLMTALLNGAFASVQDPAPYGTRKSTFSTFPLSVRPVSKRLPLIKRLLNIARFKTKKPGDGRVVLVVFAALLLTLVLAFGIFILAYGGVSEMLLIFIASGGLALIIFGAVRVVRAIKRKYRTALLKFQRRLKRSYSVAE